MDKKELKEQTLEFYSKELQILLFKKLRIIKQKKEVELQYNKDIAKIQKEDENIQLLIRIARQKIQKEFDTNPKEDIL